MSVAPRVFFVICCALVPGVASSQALPTGDSGIASRYGMDEGIAADPDVLFHDDFEAVSGRLDFDSGWDNVFGELLVTADAANVHAGSQAIEITHQSGEQSQGAWRDFGSDGVPTMHLRYYMKYHPQFPGCHHTGGGILAAAPGVDVGSSTGQVPDGTNHYTAFIDDIPPFFDWSPPGNATPGFMYVYCYHMDQGSQWGDVFMPDGSISPNQRTFTNDPNFTARPNVILDLDRWYSFEIMVQANTVGAADGRIAFWIDGEVAGDFPGLRLRGVDSLIPNVALLSTYTSEFFDNQTLYYDDVVVATSYIGPMVGVPVDPMPTGDAGTSPNDDVGNPVVPGADVGINPGGPGATPDSAGSAEPPGTGDNSDAGCCATVAHESPPLVLLLVVVVLAIRRRAL